MIKGNEQAFRILFDQYRLPLYSFVTHLTHSRADAEEIVQEVFLKLWKNRESLTDVEHPGKYIYTIARNKTLNHLAKVARDQQLARQLWLNMKTPDNETIAILDAEESRQLIQQAVASLSEQRQTIFRLSREEGLTHEEIAQQLGLSKSRVNNILVEVLRHIKDQLASHSPILATIFWLTYGHLLF
jgi:RNA polymerase sigma-70 factor (family 1)